MKRWPHVVLFSGMDVHFISVSVPESGIHDTGCKVPNLGSSIQDSGSSIQDYRSWIQGPGSWIQHPVSTTSRPGRDFEQESTALNTRVWHYPGSRILDLGSCIWIKDVGSSLQDLRSWCTWYWICQLEVAFVIDAQWHPFEYAVHISPLQYRDPSVRLSVRPSARPSVSIGLIGVIEPIEPIGLIWADLRPFGLV